MLDRGVMPVGARAVVMVMILSRPGIVLAQGAPGPAGIVPAVGFMLTAR